MATYEGMGTCDIREYHTAYENRLQLNQMSRGNLYVARFEIETEGAGYRILGRLGLVGASDDGCPVAKFELLDDDMRSITQRPIPGHIINGVWNPLLVLTVARNEDGTRKRLLNACMQENTDGDGFDTELGALLDLEQELASY